jgi:rhodanese-related sulfurtransferase
VGRDDQDARRAAGLALAIGMRSLGGVLAGGMTEWRQARRPVAHVERLDLEQLPERISSDPSLQILDVREQAERDEGYIPGSLFTSWHNIHSLPDDVDPGRPVATVCASGQRAGVAASLLQRHGAKHVVHIVAGGVPKWRELGHPVEQPERVAG